MNKTTYQKLLEFLDYAHEEVQKWPKWKRDALGIPEKEKIVIVTQMPCGCQVGTHGARCFQHSTTPCVYTNSEE